MSEIIRKDELVRRVNERLSPSIGPVTCYEAVGIIFEEIAKALATGEKIELRRFGIFEVTTRAARNARNPRTGGAVPVPARRVPCFRPGAELRRVVAGE